MVETKGRKEKNGRYELKSPLLGIFYSAPAPGMAPFVELGGIVQPGTINENPSFWQSEFDSFPTVCMVEAMKVFNDIKLNKKMPMRLIEVHVQSGDVVEEGQPLMTFEPV